MQVRSIQEMLTHPKYDTFAYYDVAVLQLDEPIEFNNFIRPICLPERSTVRVDSRRGQSVTLTGATEH